ncbi:hypothetical protein ACQP1O_12970 [Nocardia sp. CA-151230]|uniref:hypothetical protein n=1 Tax=Nocardia sp. CA-151230 TaxID=3239982 RepID=UPI003D921379
MATMDDDEISAAVVGELTPYAVPLIPEEPNPDWPTWYADDARAVLASANTLAGCPSSR